MRLKNDYRSSTIEVADGKPLRVDITKGISPIGRSDIVILDISQGDKRYRTWIAEHAATEAVISKILYAAKHSADFLETLRAKEVDYPESEELAVLLQQLGKPYFIEVAGNHEPAPVHEERTTQINFPDGFPADFEKAARRASWLSVRKRGGENIIQVCADHGHADKYNHRLEGFLHKVLSSTLKRGDYESLATGSDSTIVTLPRIKPQPVVVTPDQLESRIQRAIGFPLHSAHDHLARVKAGRDQWSGMKEPELEASIQDAGDLSKIQRAFKDVKERQTAYRWHLRGMPAAYAILKTQVDLERGSTYAMNNR